MLITVQLPLSCHPTPRRCESIFDCCSYLQMAPSLQLPFVVLGLSIMQTPAVMARGFQAPGLGRWKINGELGVEGSNLRTPG